MRHSLNGLLHSDWWRASCALFALSDERKLAFWSRVSSAASDECWPWTGARKPTGYGNVRLNGRYLSAHRAAFNLEVSPIPPGLRVLHLCDNPPCCNPAHLVLGTVAANASDMVRKGRQFQGARLASSGEGNVNSKLTNDSVATIRRRRAEGARTADLAESFGVCPSTIRNVVRGETWRHLNEGRVNGQ